MGRLPDNYVGVEARIAKFRAEYPVYDKTDPTRVGQLLVDATPVMNGTEVAGFLVKAKVLVNGVEVASDVSLVTDLDEEKALEKGAGVAKGRALVNAGYESIDASEGDSQEETEEAPKKSRFTKGESSAASPASSSGGKFKKPKAAPPKQETEETEEASEEASEESEVEEAEVVEETEKPKAPPAAAAKGGSTLQGLMAKYGVKSGSNGISNNLRK